MSNNKLTKQQKKAIFLVSIGTFLEYFDLALYIHMSTLLNELFFPQSDPIIAQLLGAVAFCTTYFLRPIGGIIIGKIGDAKGRKATITITTLLMATACLIMASTPEYREIGITASIMIIIARTLQGFSSLGEKIGAFLYMSEILKIPYKCIAAGLMGVASQIGVLFALIVASVVLSTGINWRWAFILGMFIAVIGVLARLRLKETPEFVNYKLRVEKKMKMHNQNIEKVNNRYANEKLSKKTIIAYFFTEIQSPICYYIAIIYLGDFMKKTLQMTPAEVATHNLKVSTVIAVVVMAIITYLVKKFHPIKIALISSLFFTITIVFIPYWLSNIASVGSSDAWFSLFCLQCLLFSAYPSTHGTLDAIQYKYFPVGKRFTTMATTFGVASSLGTTIVSFSLIPLNYYFGYYALWLILTPTVIGYLWALHYFKKLEIEKGLYFDYPCEEPNKPDK